MCVECTRIDAIVCVCTFHDTLTCFYCFIVANKSNNSGLCVCIRIECCFSLQIFDYYIINILYCSTCVTLVKIFVHTMRATCVHVCSFSLSYCHTTPTSFHVCTWACISVFFSLIFFLLKLLHTYGLICDIRASEWVHVSVYGYGYVYSCFLISSSSLSPLLLFFYCLGPLIFSCLVKQTHDFYMQNYWTYMN